MAKDMTPDEISEHLNSAISGLKTTLFSFSDSGNQKLINRAKLLAYWLKSYVCFVKTEDSFDPKSVLKLKRGSIIRAEFGYRVGRELGGRHYAIVLDASNSIHSDVVTVVPLSSLKLSSKPSKYSPKLKNGIFDAANNKISTAIAAVRSMPKPSDDAPVELKQNYALFLQNELSRLIKYSDDISKMKPGSLALASQITTISKMRITNPKGKNDLLYGLRLSAEDLDIIDNTLTELYFRPQAK